MSRLFWLSLTVLTLWLFTHTLSLAHLSPHAWRLCVAVLVCNPHLLRYYAIVPGMIPDQMFLFASALLLFALVDFRPLLLVVALVVAILSRQTGVVLLPGVVYWIWAGRGWKRRNRTWRLKLIGLCVLVVLVLMLTVKHVVAGVSAESSPFAQMLFNDTRPLSLRMLVEHSVRVALPIALAATLLALSCFWRGTYSVEAVSAFLMGAAIAGQPFVFSPYFNMHNQGRLAAMGVLPFSVSLAMAWNGRGLAFGASVAVALASAFAMYSLHHVCTVIGPSTDIQFACLQAVMVTVISVLFCCTRG